MNLNTKNKLFLLCLFLIVCFAGYHYSYNLGVEEGKESIARLNQVWPNFVTSTTDDNRLKIAKLAMKSNLSEVAADDELGIIQNLLNQAKADLPNDDPLRLELKEKYMMYKRKVEE